MIAIQSDAMTLAWSLPVGDERTGVRRFGHESVDAVAGALEFSQHRSVELARARKFHAHRIDEMSVHEDFVVKMRPGCEAGLPKVADNLALPDTRAFAHAAGESGKV